ncbi:hypothetical protein [Brytella acorum]|uniref:Uncharacterized protein n=1 Tax=Brytella acorum TaxID=2959299 RepID=A0AA35V416_9PROT|nr:hypothetical protein [Brytella acorum]CAI9119528.1 hypothetical protein LMG32879_000345 [Brytella acorum]
MISLRDAKHGIVIPTLRLLPPEMNTPSAVNGVAGIGNVETGYRTRQQVGGPALGFWQMEPATHADCWSRFIVYRPELLRAFATIVGHAGAPSPQLMLTNDRYACAMARVKLFRAPEPLPDADDALGWSRYWRDWYNSPLGAGTVERALPLFAAAIGA